MLECLGEMQWFRLVLTFSAICILKYKFWLVNIKNRLLPKGICTSVVILARNIFFFLGLKYLGYFTLK